MKLFISTESNVKGFIQVSGSSETGYAPPEGFREATCLERLSWEFTHPRWSARDVMILWSIAMVIALALRG